MTRPSESGPLPRRNGMRRWIEFQGVRRWAFPRYRDRVRQLYDGPRGAMLSLSSLVSLHEPLVGRLLRSGRFDVSRFRSILDIGSGAGQILRHLLKTARPDARLVAFDLSQPMLRRARRRLNDARPAYVAGDLTQLPFADGSFDCITCGWVIEHLPDPVPGLREMHRVLTPGGSALILATEDSLFGALNSRTWKCRTYNCDELHAACRRCGLEWKERLWFTPLHRWLGLGGIIIEAVKTIDQSGEAVFHHRDTETQRKTR